jgi:hypothetical protein
MRSKSVVVALASLALTACGSSGGGSGVKAAEQPYVDALKQSMVKTDSEGLTLTDKQASCLAPKWIRILDPARLKAKGITPADVGADSSSDLTQLGLSDAEGGKLYDALGDCNVDVKQVFITGINPDLSAEDTKCLDDNLDDALLKQIMVTELTKGDTALQADNDLVGKISAVFDKCPGAAGSSGQSAACDADLKTMQIAAEAYRAQNSAYPSDQTALNPFLNGPSTLHTYSANDGHYTITGINECVGSDFTSP